MCLARAYMRPVNDSSPRSEQAGASGSLLLMENVAYVEVDGEELLLRSLFGDTQTLRGRIASIDFSENRLMLQPVGTLATLEAQDGTAVSA
jgi:predicted RNA-binding protein